MTEPETKSLLHELSSSVTSILLTFIFCCCLYTCAVWITGNIIVPDKAEGSLIRNSQGEIIGSRLIAQKFTRPEYFWSRPSSVDYNGKGSGGSNLSPANPALRQRIQDAIKSVETENNFSIPPDLVMASGSGLDPHITIQSAAYQIERVARARGAETIEVQKLIEKTLSSPAPWGQLSLVNVLELNLLLDQEFPVKK